MTRYLPQRRVQRRWVGAVTVVLLIIGIGFIVWALVVPVIPEPPILPDDEPSPTVVLSTTPGPTPTPASGSATTTPVSEAIQNPRGKPVKIKVVSAKDGVIIHARLVATRLRSDGRLVPPAGEASWLADEGWPKPGVLSRYNSIVAGHVSGGGKPDVFYELSKARKGDEVIITYDSGDRVIVKITKNPVNVGKKAVADSPKYDWVWESIDGEKHRIVTLFTCNPESEHVGGHSVDNWVTQGEVVHVTQKK